MCIYNEVTSLNYMFRLLRAIFRLNLGKNIYNEVTSLSYMFRLLRAIFRLNLGIYILWSNISQLHVSASQSHLQAEPRNIYIYIIYRVFSNLIRTSFCRFLKQKKKSVRGYNPYLSFSRPLPTRQTDWIILDITNALTVIRLTRHVWISVWATDNDSVISDDGDSDE